LFLSDIRNQAGIRFLEFGIKNAEKFSIPSPEGTNAVQIMTIHKSKGLEFPVVIFPFAERRFRKPKDKLWLNAEEQDFGFIDNSTAVEGLRSCCCFQSKKTRRIVDNINVLYVALTRAEEQLYVISNMIYPVKGTKNNR
jgi:ATP-dependent exoDNAse (exonuclease V) beta subunit